jgi:hypothetical protein
MFIVHEVMGMQTDESIQPVTQTALLHAESSNYPILRMLSLKGDASESGCFDHKKYQDTRGGI